MMRLRAMSRIAGLAMLLVAAVPADGQSLLERTPDMGGTWVGESGVLHFHFMHRFDATAEPTRKVMNTPTFLFAAGLPHRVLLGTRYATSSDVRTGFPNEWEFFGRWSPFAGGRSGAPPVALHVGWNQATGSVDGELSGSIARGPVRLLGAVRGFSSPYNGDDPRAAAAAGAVVRITDWLALAGDAAMLLDRSDAEEIAWGGGLQLAIPTTPHTLSLHASNVMTTTLEGASRGSDAVRWGFEFTVPLTLARYLGGGGDAAPVVMQPGDTVAAQVNMTNRLVYTPAQVRIRAGQSVEWVNGSAVVHTVTADPARAVEAASVALPEGAATFDSGDLAPGERFVHRFDVPGTYRYFCVPHELAGMVGVVVVEP